MITFRRAVALAGKKDIDVGDVAESLLDWSDSSAYAVGLRLLRRRERRAKGTG